MSTRKKRHMMLVGGTGFVGLHLTQYFFNEGWDITILTRQDKLLNKPVGYPIRFIKDLPKDNASVDVVINVAGAPIDGKRWTEDYKKTLVKSRVDTTKQVVAWIGSQTTKPRVFINGSAVGYYGTDPETIFSEEKPSSGGFTHDLCRAWEDAAMACVDHGVRVCIMRLGVVLGRQGGMLSRVLPFFKWGLGGVLGTGQQWLSWVHMDDVIRAVDFMMQHDDVQGPVNVVSPEAVINKDFTTTLGRLLHRPTFMPQPSFMIRLLFGEMGDTLLLHGQHVVPTVLMQKKFHFAFPRLDDALTSII